MNAAEEVAHRGAGLHRCPVGKSRRVHDAAHRLDGQVHGRQVAIWSREAEARTAAVDEPRVLLLQELPAEAQTVHHADREVLDDHVGLSGQTEEQRLAVGVLQVEDDGLLVGVQHDERIGLDLALAAPHDVALG